MTPHTAPPSASYAATQARVSVLYADRKAWGRKAILNVGCPRKFSSDRAIEEYAGSIWGAVPVPVTETNPSESPGRAVVEAMNSGPFGNRG